jgi:group I intron endonuclease
MKGIYKITNPNNKIYIGQSTNIDERIKRYKKLQCKKQRILYNSLNKYGWDNHIFEIIEIVDNDDLLIERETYWKNYYKVLEVPSLCCRIDGIGGNMSDKTRKLLSKSMKNYWNNLSNIQFNERIKLNKQTTESKQKIKDKLTGVKKTKSHIENLIKSQNKPETIEKRKKSLRDYWDNMTDDERERLRKLNILSQNRPEVKLKLSLNNPSRRPEVKEKQRQAALNRIKIECPYCHKFMDAGNSKKYHFDKCKFKV